MSDLEGIKKQALKDFAEFVSPMKARTMKSAGLDIIEDRREGASVWDITGRKYIDCQTGSGIMNAGRHNREIIDALKDALDTYDIGVFLLCSRQKADLAKKLAEIAPGDLKCSIFGTGGGEANDAAIKLARGYTMKPEIIYAEKAYHGHTGFALSAIGRDAYKEPFEPLVPGFKMVPFGDAEAVRSAMTKNTAAVILEPIQGEGGINIPPDGYLQEVRAICDEHEALLILDEIQTGLARTGKMFASEHWGVVPDIMTVAKSLGGGIYPISATVFKEELMDFFIPHPFIHLSTFGGSDLGCIVALATIAYIEKHDLAGNAERMGRRFRVGFDRLLADYPDLLLEVRQKGLMMGLQYTNQSIGPRLTKKLAERGVIAVYTGNDPTICRFMPSLVITAEEVDFVLNALEESMRELSKEGGIGKND
ncbi:MAG TPA: aspartate aminotransferase family protein [Deltaproteobacteria bacterium]|jgi:acetylornithine/succinyldiaminopimelate/putrescine aminotransferase|nr:aspartate aminotransferase family protein [Deltaproteobacteria bacterium]HOI07173.1 aspartate aminotransferase family protein [Deltaproteobacteria bacterium]